VSDENEQIPESGSMFFMQLPPEIQDYISHQRMHMSQTAHDVRDFFEGLDEAQLRHFRGLLGVMIDRPESIHYYVGLVGGLLSQKFNVCLACSKNHDEELKGLADHEPVLPPQTDSDQQAPVDPEVQALAEVKMDMAEYQVAPITEGDWYGPVICTGQCDGASGNAKWKNLDERKESRPGSSGCTFCQQKAGWG
jgi:hypothetical protein